MFRFLRSYFNEIVKEGENIGCIAVFGMFTINMIWNGVIKSLAVMLPTLQEQFGASTWLVGWMIALIDGTCDLAGTSALPCRQKKGRSHNNNIYLFGQSHLQAHVHTLNIFKKTK